LATDSLSAGKAKTYVDMDKIAASSDAKDSPGSNSQRMPHASPFHTVAPEATPRCVADVGEPGHIPKPTAPGIDVTRLH